MLVWSQAIRYFLCKVLEYNCKVIKISGFLILVKICGRLYTIMGKLSVKTINDNETKNFLTTFCDLVFNINSKFGFGFEHFDFCFTKRAMFKQSAPFKQFRLVFKIFGYIPKEISLTHKLLVLLLFIQFELFYGFLLIGSLFQEQKSATAFMTQAFQTPLMISFVLKAFYFFSKFSEVDNLNCIMSKLFDAEKSNKIFDDALKFCKQLSLVYSTVYGFAVLFPPIAAFIIRSPLVVMWKPSNVDAELFFYFHWIQESIGNIYLAIMCSATDLLPFCIMIMIQGYLLYLNKKLRTVKTNTELFECVEKSIEIRKVIAEFQRIFSPALFMQSAALVGSFCATLLIVTTDVSLK